ncbi:MAG: PQQ-like domain, partial [Acidobacteria bacterium]|nr:PQQ-like domain [Acidobacteriota bacterium]
FDAGSGLTASPAIAAGRVVIGSQDGVLYCFG